MGVQTFVEFFFYQRSGFEECHSVQLQVPNSVLSDAWRMANTKYPTQEKILTSTEIQKLIIAPKSVRVGESE
jgi:hypothetical protein